MGNFKINYISGEKFQDLCDNHFSMYEYLHTEVADYRYIDITKYSQKSFDNGPLVYLNLDLIGDPIDESDLTIESRETQIYTKDKKPDLVKVFSTFKNKFSLLLHNNDQWFGKEHLYLFDIPNLDKIYSQNTLVTHDRLIPLPIGIGNEIFPYGGSKQFQYVDHHKPKSKEIYFNFRIEGGCRDVKRPDCVRKAEELGIPWTDSVPQDEYIKNLSDYKFTLSPEGNGIDCHRTWEALYLKVIPIVDRNAVTEFYSKYFPMVLVDKWEEFKLEDLEGVYETADWSNYRYLHFDLFVKKFINV